MLKITVAVPCYRSEQFISKCMDSLVNQSMADDEYEIICVDDRSTDRTVEVLHEYQSRYHQVKVIERETNSGGPGEPRNQAIEAAKGKYIFFVDSDDYLGTEALERLYNFAEEHDSDVILGKMQGVNGRGVPKAIFKETNPNVDLVDSVLVYALGPTKMFRVSMLKENNIWFPTNIKATEDQVFVMNAFLHASVISVLADYDCYYAVLREGDHMTFAYVSPQDYYDAMKVIIDMIKTSRLSETRKEKLIAKFLNRHFEFSRTTDFTTVLQSEDEQREWMNELYLFVQKNIPAEVDTMVKNHFRLRLYFIRHNDLTGFKQFEHEEENLHDFAYVEQGNIFANFPSLSRYEVPKEALKMNHKNQLIHFVEDIAFENYHLLVKGSVHHTALTHQSERQNIVGVWVNRQTKLEKRFKPDVSEGEQFIFRFPFNEIAETDLDISVWDLFIDSYIDGYRRRGRIGRNRQPYQYKSHAKFLGNNGFSTYTVRPYFTKDFDNLSLEFKAHNTGLKVEISEDEPSSYLTITIPKQQLFFPQKSILLFKINNQELLVPIKEIITKPDQTELNISRHLIADKMASVQIFKGDVDIFINSYQTRLDPIQHDFSALLCSYLIHKKRWFLKSERKVDVQLKANHSTFYLTSR
ncbi:glycosyltransferase [Bacillus sp. CLL-7-23]|uniref:Glycosyltransferase n=1 Tax=Bacillus changyiensis TaxID=3004103 RepID=A0ABT4X259_9BACI|nr:glycosyltransferase [Bacillus changyiensis]MDA7025491.1 glycosyltransferase [Bacillus changyiensis]